MTLGDVVLRIGKDFLGQTVVYIYQQALAQRPLSELLDELKISA